MKIYNHLYMGNLKSALATLGAVTLAACGNAEAADTNNAPVKAELSNMAAVVETTKITRKQCIALLPDKDKLKVCMVELSAQNKAEIAALDKGLTADASEIAIKKDVLETEQVTGQQLDTMNEVLANQVEGLKKVVAIQERDSR